jgi:predicted NAD/FAD-dependent oxidoreductase
MIDLNHRYALDGCDPASYGGLLWCLGAFDRPFEPPRRIYGAVRSRSTADHARRLDPTAYLARTTRPWTTPTPRVAVVGAGIAGLTAARTLQDHGFEVVVFDKARGPGGRTATRRATPELHFDHGAQYFTARDPHFARYVDAWLEQGVVAEWSGRFVAIDRGEVHQGSSRSHPRYVAAPHMTSLARRLAEDLKVRLEAKIVRHDQAEGRWRLADESGRIEAGFDHVVVSTPAPQAAELLGGHAFAARARGVAMTPCWTALAAFEGPVAVPWDGATIQGSPLAWAARNNTKPGRDPAKECWVLQASADWTAARLDLTRDEASALLLAAFAEVASTPLPSLIHHDAHRWLFSATPTALGQDALFDPEAGLVVCGDWLLDGRVEGAFRSGAAAAGFLLRQHGLNPVVVDGRG